MHFTVKMEVVFESDSLELAAEKETALKLAGNEVGTIKKFSVVGKNWVNKKAAKPKAVPPPEPTE